MVQQLHLTHRQDPNWYFHSGTEWTWSNGNEGVLHISQSSRTDSLMSYPRHSSGRFCPSAEIQSAGFSVWTGWASKSWTVTEKHLKINTYYWRSSSVNSRDFLNDTRHFWMFERLKERNLVLVGRSNHERMRQKWGISLGLILWLSYLWELNINCWFSTFHSVTIFILEILLSISLLPQCISLY